MARRNQPGGEKERQSFGQWVAARRDNNPVIAALLLLAAVLGAVVVVFGGIVSAVSWYDDTFSWRDDEYDKLHELHAGFTVGRFEQELGEATFAREVRRRPRRKGRVDVRNLVPLGRTLIERTFQGRDHWVQTVANAQGTVVMWAVTSCDEDFRPSFSTGWRTSDERPALVLRESVLGDVVPKQVEHSLQAYYVRGVTRNTFYFEIAYGGNPGNYQSVAWGWSDSCGGETNSLYLRAGFPDLQRGRYDGLLRDANSSVEAFRELAPVNSYAETAPGITFDELTPSVQIGADRLLTRTAP